ncbi:IclR family transcriptional regulator, partial [Streptomyces carpinensis]
AAARAAELPVSSAHRILGRLVEERFATYDEDARRYALGWRVLELSRGFQRSPAGYSAAAAPMRRLAARTGLPVIAGILHGTDVLLVLSVQGTQHLQLRSAEGTRNPWHATSLGKALVAGLPEEEREHLLRGPLPQVTPRTITDPDRLRAELALVRERGWGEVDEENEIGVRSIAAAVPHVPERTPPLAVSLAATVILTEAGQLRAQAPALRQCVEDIAAHMAP